MCYLVLFQLIDGNFIKYFIYFEINNNLKFNDIKILGKLLLNKKIVIFWMNNIYNPFFKKTLPKEKIIQ